MGAYPNRSDSHGEHCSDVKGRFPGKQPLFCDVFPTHVFSQGLDEYQNIFPWYIFCIFLFGL